ncbi:DEAD/DEAH box helicase family protein [bacterium]|nr:DEAD/DEAH box helicase family protein [bacterium]
MLREGYKFYSKELGCPLKDDASNQEINIGALNNKCVIFYSMQDIKTSSFINEKSRLNKNELLLNVRWDLIIIDEADEGTTSELGLNLIDILKKCSPNVKFLYLSGTPYRIYKQFSTDEIFSWTYNDEQKAKEEFNAKAINPYINLPELKLYLINLKKDMNLSSTSYTDKDDKYFSFDEFFKCDENNKNHFANEQAVKQFLNLLIDHEKSEYPFSNEKYRDYFKHTFWCLPSKNACNALENLLNNHPFFGFGNYGIVNLSANSKNPLSDERKVEKAIRNNKRTITLSVRKMTRGATVGQ